VRHGQASPSPWLSLTLQAATYPRDTPLATTYLAANPSTS